MTTIEKIAAIKNNGENGYNELNKNVNSIISIASNNDGCVDSEDFIAALFMLVDNVYNKYCE